MGAAVEPKSAFVPVVVTSTRTTASILEIVTTAPAGTEALRALSMAALVMMALTPTEAVAATFGGGGGVPPVRADPHLPVCLPDSSTSPTMALISSMSGPLITFL